jgi:putative oxidoreductase
LIQNSLINSKPGIENMNMKKLMATTDSWGLLGLRLVAGAVFIAHGLPKFGIGGGNGLEGTASWLGSLGIPLPMLSTILVASSEAIGGVLLIAGFMTRFVAATQVIAMLVAVFLVHWSNGFTGEGGYQWALLLCAAAFALMMDGAGKFSIDRSMSR